jgi:hypothetical protein
MDNSVLDFDRNDTMFRQVERVEPSTDVVNVPFKPAIADQSNSPTGHADGRRGRLTPTLKEYRIDDIHTLKFQFIFDR